MKAIVDHDGPDAEDDRVRPNVGAKRLGRLPAGLDPVPEARRDQRGRPG